MGPSTKLMKGAKKHGRIILYGLCFLLLVAIAIWDVTNIIADYMFDNRLASVHIIYQKNCSPILQIDPIVMLTYQDKKSIFIETWSMNDSEFEAIRRRWVHRHDFCDGRNNHTGFSNFSLQEKLDLVQLYDFVWSVDRGDYNNQRIDDIAREHGINRSDLDSTIDAFSKNPQCIEKLLQKLWDEVKVNFVQPTDGGGVELVSIGRTVITFRLNIRRDLRNLMRDGYQLDRRRKNKKNSDDNNIYTYGAYFQFIFPESYEDIVGVVDGHWADIVVQITNVGVYDSSAFPPCTREFKTKEECFKNLTAHVTADVCHCIPFTDREWFDNKTTDTRPYCTTKHYNVCREKAKNESVEQQELESDSCNPCVIAKNNYFVRVRDPPVWYEDPSEWHHRASLSFTCLDLFHTYYTEKVQFSFPQLVSQVGGDLGLYIGFSMLSVLSLFLFVYGLYRQRNAKVYDVTDYPLPLLPYSIQFAVRYALETQPSVGGSGIGDVIMKRTSDAMVHGDCGREIVGLKNAVDELDREMKLLISRNNAPVKGAK